ncbi:FliH/SctL family protein [Krasilnikovia sp. MM14-A1004]|uniref:FliH/SctL family protein n=1 Tax=Krasilnikovia sp. MM14-A1004 TaxID=3373541 RepID=UPI00399C8B63
MNSLTEQAFLRGSDADAAATVRFAVDLRRRAPMDTPPIQRAKDEARATGYAEGWTQGKRDAALEHEGILEKARADAKAHVQWREAVLDQAMDAIVQAADKLEARYLPAVEDLQEAILEHAFVLAEAIIGRTLADVEGRGIDAVRRAMAIAPTRGAVTVSLHPDDYEHLVGGATETDYNYEGRPVQLRPDPALQPGDAVAEVGATKVDASIAAAVQRAREALLL